VIGLVVAKSGSHDGGRPEYRAQRSHGVSAERVDELA
jgi:hypothetical protein